MTNPIQAAKDRRAVSPRDAREQSAAYFGFAASVDIQVGDDVFEVPNPGLMDDDQQERYNDLQAEIENTCDREDDIVIPDRTLDDGTVIPGRTIKGDLKQPNTVDGVPLKPPYNTRLAIALFGAEGYAKFKAGGGRSNQVALIWAQMQREFEAKVSADSKSGDSVGGSEDVSEGNPL
jgi:hypothetical protein